MSKSKSKGQVKTHPDVYIGVCGTTALSHRKQGNHQILQTQAFPGPRDHHSPGKVAGWTPDVSRRSRILPEYLSVDTKNSMAIPLYKAQTFSGRR